MIPDPALAVTLILALIGACIAAGRLLEREKNTRDDLRKLEATVARELGEVKRVLYTTVGGRRAIRPIEGDRDVSAETE